MAIYARLENGTYAEVTGVYKTDGTEITEIFQGDRLVYSATNEIYGTVPLYYDGLGYELIDYLISGNAVQDGTPSSDAPVDVVGSEVRTGNLVDESKVTFNTYIDSQGTTGNSNVSNLTDYIDIGALPFVLSGVRTNDIMNSSTRALCYYDSNKNHISGTSYEPDIMTMPVRFSKNPKNAKYVRFAFDKAFENGIMLNLGSTALPYEPYGYKLPLTVNGTEYPIYLGQVETTRRVKKLVLTGTTRCLVYDYNSRRGFKLPGLKGKYTRAQGICTHYPVYNGTSYNDCLWLGVSDSTLYFVGIGTIMGITEPEEFQAYLAQQYANGTPVTVWYVLAEPETAIVNEPLMKIGDYADTISFAQAGVTIPTVNGANVLDMTSTVKPSEVYVKGKGIKPTGYGQLADVNGVNILDNDGRPIYVHGQ